MHPQGVDRDPMGSDSFEPKQATEPWARLSGPPKKPEATVRAQMPPEPHTSPWYPREGMAQITPVSWDTALLFLQDLFQVQPWPSGFP